MTAPEETAARALKACHLAEAFRHLAAPCDGERATPAEVLDLATTATDATWATVEALAGTRPASRVTRAVVVGILAVDAHQLVDVTAGWS